MKATFNRQSLIAALKKVVPCCESKQFYVLNNCLVSVKDNKATITGTNLNTTIQVNLDVEKVKEDGNILLDAKRVLTMLSTQSADSIDISTNGSVIQINAAKFKSNLPSADVMEYPPVTIPEIKGVKVNGSEFRAAVQKALTSVATDQSRPEFTGVWIVVDKSSMMLVSTDGHRLAKCVIQSEGGETALTNGTIIDAAGLKSIMGSIDAETVTMDVVKGKFAVANGNGDVFTASTIAGTFPNFSSIFPESSACTIRADRSELAKALKTISLFSPKGNTIRLELAKGQLFLSTTSDVGEAIQSIDVENDGKFIGRMGMSWRFLLDACAALDGNTISLGITDADSPLVATNDGSKKDAFLIMPMQL